MNAFAFGQKVELRMPKALDPKTARLTLLRELEKKAAHHGTQMVDPFFIVNENDCCVQPMKVAKG